MPRFVALNEFANFFSQICLLASYVSVREKRRKMENEMVRNSGNANDNLQQAMALLIRNQAALLSQLTEDHKRLSKNERDLADIKGDLAQIKAILLRHDQVLADLPEAIRQKVGFKSR